MVYELLWKYFVPNDFASGFKKNFKVCGHIVWSHVPPLVLHLIFTFWFLALNK
jgi:hypothetical protein